MTTENDVSPTGTGQEGAGSPAGATVEVPVKPVDKLDQIANRSAHKGLDRELNNDATIFTK